MDGFFVDLHDLDRTAQAMQRVGGEVAENGVLKYSIMPRAVGHHELSAALSEFDDGSRQAISALSAMVAEAADRMQLALAQYRDVDAAIHDALAATDRPESDESSANNT